MRKLTLAILVSLLPVVALGQGTIDDLPAASSLGASDMLACAQGTTITNKCSLDQVKDWLITYFDTEAEMEGVLTDVANLIISTEIDTEAELEALLSDVSNMLVSTELDTEAELEALLGDVTDVLTNNDTITADAANADTIDAITEIAAALRLGSDLKLATGNAGSTDECAKWNVDGDLVSAGAPCGTGGGDSLSIDSSAVVDPDFVSTGDVDFVDTSNTITANLNIDVIDATHMANADHGDISWSNGFASLDDSTVDSPQINDDSILEVDLNADNVAVADDILTFSVTADNFAWQTPTELSIGLTRQAATDCTAETGGATDEQCHEADDNKLYICESGPCNGSGWIAYAGTGATTETGLESDLGDTTNVLTDNDASITFDGAIDLITSANGDIDFSPNGTGEVNVNSALNTQATAAPTIAFKDSDSIADPADDNATISGNLTDTGDGTEDMDVLFQQQVAGTPTDFLAANADGVGNARIVFPDSSIGPDELLAAGQTDEYALTYEATGDTWEWTAMSAGTPGGSTTQVQFNDASAFGGDAGLTYNKTTDALTVGTGAGTITGSAGGVDLVLGASDVATIGDGGTTDYVQIDENGVTTFAGAASLAVPNGATPTTDATAEIALDTTITDHQPLIQYYDGAENMTVIAIDTAQLPALDNEIVKYDAATDKFVLEADAGAAGGDSVSIDSVAVVDPDFVSTADIDFIDTSNTVTADINADAVEESHLNAVGAPTDEYCLTYEQDTTNFAWQTCGAGGGDSVSIDSVGVVDPDFVSTGDIDFVDTSNTVTANINAGSIIETDLNEDSGTPTDEDVLTYDSTGTNFNWVAQSTLAAGTAAALAANGGNCASGEIPLGVDTAGAVEGCYEPSEADISDLAHTATAITDGLVVEADLNEDSGTPTDEDVLTYDSTGANFNWAAQSSLAAGTAAALAANGGNCTAGSYPLGVDTAGAVETCTDASTEIDSIVATHTLVVDAHIDHADSLAELNSQISSGLVTGAHFSPTAGISTDHGAGAVVATTDLVGTMCGTNEILEDQGAAWACISTPSGAFTSFDITDTDASPILTVDDSEQIQFIGAGTVTIAAAADTTNHDITITGSAHDGTGTDDQGLTITAGGADDSVIDIEDGTDVTISGGTLTNVTEAASTITIEAVATLSSYTDDLSHVEESTTVTDNADGMDITLSTYDIAVALDPSEVGNQAGDLADLVPYEDVTDGGIHHMTFTQVQTLVADGTGTDDQTAAEVAFTPDDGAEWTDTDPVNVDEALENLAPRVIANTAKTTFPGFDTVANDYSEDVTDDDLSDDLIIALSGVTTVTDGSFCQGGATNTMDCDVAPNGGTDITADLEEEAQVGTTNFGDNAADDEIPLGSAANTASWVAMANCVGENHLQYTAATNTFSCDDDDTGAVSEDSVGTTELDDGADTPATGEYLRVDTVDQAGIEYRSTSEVLGDIGAAASGANSDITSLSGLTTDLTVAQGGTGAGTFTDGGILLGSGTGAITALGEAANGQIPIGDGSTDPVLNEIDGTANEIEITDGAGTIQVGIVTSPTLDGSNFTGVAAGAYDAASIDGDDIAPSIAGRSLTLASASPDVINLDAGIYTGSKCIYIEDPVTDEEFESIFRAPANWTITEIYCEATGGTSVEMDFEIDDGTATGVNDSVITCTTSGVTDSTLAGDVDFDDGDRMDLDLGTVSGSVDALSACFEYTIDDA